MQWRFETQGNRWTDGWMQGSGVITIMMPSSFLIKLNLFRLISQCSTTPFRRASRNLGSTWRGDSGGLRSANDEDAVMNVYRTQALLFDVHANRFIATILRMARFYRAKLCTARYCCSSASVCLPVSLL